MKHVLKTEPPFYDHIASGRKRFEIRRDDRGFRVGEDLILKEYDATRPEGLRYTGRKVEARISYMTAFEQKDDFVVLGIILKRSLWSRVIDAMKGNV